MLEYILNTLEENERKIILEECGINKEFEEKTQSQIGRELGLSRQRVSQIEARALQKLQSNAYKINNGIPVEQEYFFTKDIKKELKRKGITTICVLDHQVFNKSTRFKCKICGNEFIEKTTVFIKNTECPYCNEENKQFIKK